ncbi:hypothetical protein [Vibrio breoganii]|uniref:hypothetical protein n=1 Tax=Vibrio breoganii TaxID=553239 RepID=UPI0021C411F6|nr:hypothetical protein [Vibrio breoganii]MDN3717752.1 hypothetical protein [Vibrio breoganii]
MAYSSSFTLTLLPNTDLGQFLGSSIQLVAANASMCETPSLQEVLAHAAIHMASVQGNKILAAMSVNNMTIDINNNGIIECWQCFALCSNESGQAGALFALIGTKRAQTRRAR